MIIRSFYNSTLSETLANPIPFKSSVKLLMYLSHKDHVSLSIFELNGREVSRLVDGMLGLGIRRLFGMQAVFRQGFIL